MNKKTKIRRRISLVVAVLCAGLLVVFLMSPSEIDQMKVHPSLRGGEFVGMTHLGDGGTVIMLFLDSSGREVDVCHPAPGGDIKAFRGRLFLGSDYKKLPANEIVGFPHTEKYLARKIREKSSAWSEEAFEASRMAWTPLDRVKIFFVNLIGSEE